MAIAKLTALTPVHVGSGEKLLRNFDFVVENGEVGFLNLEKVLDKIGVERLPQLTSEIEKKQLLSFLKQAIPNEPLSAICSRGVKTRGHITSSTRELKVQYRTAMEGPCIPGSSLKGSFRTSMLTYLTSEERNNEAKQKQFISGVNWERINFNKLDGQLFGETANAKSTRFLMVGDIQFKDNDVEIQELSYINQLGNGEWEYETRKLQLVECIKKGANSTFQLKLNLELAKKYRENKELPINLTDIKMAPLKDLSFFNGGEEGFLRNVNAQAKKLLEWEIKTLEDLEAEPDLIESLSDVLDEVKGCKSGEAVLRVGGHNGWNFMTGRWMMYNAEVFTDEMFDKMQQSAQRTNRYLGRQFPKTRKMTDSGLPMGFVKMKLLG